MNIKTILASLTIAVASATPFTTQAAPAHNMSTFSVPVGYYARCHFNTGDYFVISFGSGANEGKHISIDFKSRANVVYRHTSTSASTSAAHTTVRYQNQAFTYYMNSKFLNKILVTSRVTKQDRVATCNKSIW